MARYGLAVLGISLGPVFVGFGVLKFVPGLSPVEDLVSETIDVPTLGLIPDGLELLLVATLKTVVGLLLLTGRFLRLGLRMLGLVIVGILSPLILFPDRLFTGAANAPTLEGPYILKDMVLLAAGLVLAAGARDGAVISERAQPRPQDLGAPSPKRIAAWLESMSRAV